MRDVGDGSSGRVDRYFLHGGDHVVDRERIGFRDEDAAAGRTGGQGGDGAFKVVVTFTRSEACHHAQAGGDEVDAVIGVHIGNRSGGRGERDLEISGEHAAEDNVRSRG